MDTLWFIEREISMKTERNFTVTLLISTYNKPDYLRQTLLSVAHQTVLPDEVVIADDGSTNETRQLIDDMRSVVPVPIQHVWHPDTGFRLSEIRNKAIAAAKGEYIIQIDGDVILERHFIADHLDVAEPGAFVCGSRLLLTPQYTQKVLSEGMKVQYGLASKFDYVLNNLRIGWLRRYLAPRFAKGQPARLRGCNMAFWKSDLILVNGYNEDMASWGGEDIEIAWHLIYSGVQKKMLKFGGVMYHLYHPETSKEKVSLHQRIIDAVKREQSPRCINGLDKHL